MGLEIQDVRSRVAFYLEDLETPFGKVLALGLAGLVLVSSAIFVSESYAIAPSLRSVLDNCDRVILVIFTIEYLLRLWCSEQPIKYIFSFYSLIDLVAILPFLFGNANVGFFRILRWFRILKLVRFIGGKTVFGYVTGEDAAIFTRIIFTILSIIFVYAGLIYQVEHPGNPQFKTFLDAIYFCVSTLTTAGFGDITPKSQLGKFLTVLASLTGVVLIPWQLGDLIRRLVKTEEQRSIVCLQCGWEVHDLNARFCKRCGTGLPEEIAETQNS
jgi:voltage-gated potassium channel